MSTARALVSFPDDVDDEVSTVYPSAGLMLAGWTANGIRAQVDARRWQRVGRSLVLHNGPLTIPEQRRATLLNCGPRAVLTSFTATEVLGLKNWARPDTHVLVPSTARVRRVEGLPVRIHYINAWGQADVHPARPVQRLAPAAVRAAGTFASARPACAILAACVQQRLTTVSQLSAAVVAQPRLKHRHLLQAALADISQGAQALSEIDFFRLCRRYSLPLPMMQRVRPDRMGKRRYLDAEWVLPDGRIVAAEVDGALHLSPLPWVADQLRQNEMVISGTSVLRFATVLLRCDPARVADQLGRMLASRG